MAHSLQDKWNSPTESEPGADDGDVAMTDAEAPTQSAALAVPDSSAATSTLAKFKAAQDLKIETENLPSTTRSRAATISASASSSTSSDRKPVPKPPASTGKKRRRRTAAQIDRKYSCNYPGCNKAYGSEGSLTQHQRLKHRTPQQGEPGSMSNSNPYLTPLRCAGAASTTGKTINIRPATAFGSDLAVLDPTNPSLSVVMDLSATLGPPASKTPRSTLRSRSNSMPVTFSPPQPHSVTTATNIALASASGKTPVRPPAALKPRRSGTPHPKAASTRRSKRRSKSESLEEARATVTPSLHALDELDELDELAPPRSDRSVSDSTASIHETILPLSSTGSFEWPPSSVPASSALDPQQLHTSASLSSDDQAIDSDILSVLANCDSADLADASSLGFGSGSTGGPPSTCSYRSNTSFGDSEDAEMLPVGMECFKITEDRPAMVGSSHDDNRGSHLGDSGLYNHLASPDNQLEHDSGLQAFGSMDDEWTGAMHLSSHLERMSVVQASGDTPPQDLGSMLDQFTKTKQPAAGGEPFTSSTDLDGDPMSHVDPAMGVITPLDGMTSFSAVDSDVFALKHIPSELDNQLVDNNLSHSEPQWYDGFTSTGGDLPQPPASSTATMKLENNTQQHFWMRGGSQGSDSSTPSDLETSNQLEDMMDSVPQQHDRAMEWSSAKFAASTGFHDELLDGEAGTGYGLGDPRLASMLLCSREEL